MRHILRIAAVWAVLSAAAELLITLAPVPAPTGSPEGVGERQTLFVLSYVGAPVFVLVCVLFLYAVVVRRRPGEAEGRTAPAGSTPIVLWACTTFAIVIFLASWGTLSLHEITGPPHPSVAAADPTGHRQDPGSAATRPLIIQAIGRQWSWTFRYPSYGGMVTRDLVVPYNVPIQFHITSLDVVHSLWIYDYDVKEDAVPGVDNTAWFLARRYGRFTSGGANWVKCNELCGIGHSYMVSGLYVKTQAAFVSWARAWERFERSIHLLRRLPRYSLVYYPATPSDWPLPPKNLPP